MIGCPYLPTLAYKHKALFANMVVNDDSRTLLAKAISRVRFVEA